MLLAVALSRCDACGGWLVVGDISALTASDTGIIIAGTLMLFPTAAAGARVRIGEAVGRFEVNEKGEVALTFKPEDIAFLFDQPDEQA